MRKIGCRHLLSMTLLAMSAGCGLFTPRDSEPPLLTQNRTDPLGFSELLKNTSINFTNLDYGDLFATGMTYQQLGQLPQGKTELVNHLHVIESQYPAISVRWVRSYTPPVFSTTDTNDLFGVKYAVFLDTTRQAVNPDYTGTCDFKVWYSNAWTISAWNDQPDSLINNLSFFCPPP